MLKECFLVCSSLILFCFLQVDGTIISKSDITICENTAKDPLNILYNKRCEKKLVVLAEVSGGQVIDLTNQLTNRPTNRLTNQLTNKPTNYIVTLNESIFSLVFLGGNREAPCNSKKSSRHCRWRRRPIVQPICHNIEHVTNTSCLPDILQRGK